MFTYCGNNPVVRKDDGGESWFVQFGIGLATQYIADVVSNLAAGRTGFDALRPTSTLGEYIASGVSAMIPGGGLGKAFARNAISEGIEVTERIISGKEVSVIDSIVDISVGTLLDRKFDKLSSKVSGLIKSKLPRNYSSYAYSLRQLRPNLTQEQISKQMRREINFNCFASNVVSRGFDVVRSLLPY